MTSLNRCHWPAFDRRVSRPSPAARPA